ncbi:zinc-dependent metalloprotease [Balneola sp. MJW-20]|uniref:zinc-dependent metalloprotease n=1 Tax=Gracilimonas aurantiaca TaxID=3234185 RepID=UPI003465F668
MKKWIPVWVIAFLLMPVLVTAQDKENGDDADKYAELIKDAEFHEGFFNLYTTEDKMYLEVKEENLERDFLMNFEIAQGIGASGVFGGTMLNIFEGLLVNLEKHEGKIFLVQKPSRYTAEEGSAAERAVDLTFGSSILETAKVEATDEDGKMLINVYDWFVSDLSQVSQRVERAASNGNGPGRISFDKSRSYLSSVKSFPMNTEIEAKLSFRNQGNSAPRTVPDARYIPVSVHYSIAQLPEEPMSPRLADDRIGYFMTVHKDFTSDEESFFRRYVNKWRLECANEPDAEGLCDPKEPITYYIEPTVPVEYRQVMIDAINEFDRAFEAAGFRNGIEAKMLPEGADAEDIRYATLRWNVSDQSGYGAIGPSVVDPRTGEILDADILFEANMVQGWKNFYRTNVDPTTAVNELFEMSEDEATALRNGAEMASMADEIASQGTLLRSALIARGELAPDTPVPAEYVNQAMNRVTMHEVGHTLGLRHNFRSSADTPFDKLHDKDYTMENGLASSVMEYPGINIAPPGEDQGYFYSPSVGSYDLWVISYGYTPDDDRAAEIARQAAQPGHAYGPDEDARGSGALDPNVNTYDLSSDPMQWGMQRSDLVKNIWAELPDHVLADNVPYFEVTDAFTTLFSQYARAVAPAVKYIGGQYQYRDHKGDPDARAPFINVPKERQQAALDFLIEAAFAEDAFELPVGVYEQFGANRWNHWGVNNTYRGRIDFPLHESLVSFQSSILGQLVNPSRLSRIRDGEVKFGQQNMVTIPEMFGQITNAIWSEVWSAPGDNISSLRRDLQRAYIDGMSELVTDAPNGTPADARSVARMMLQDLHDRISRRLTPPYSFDAYTEAHLREVKVRIEKTLDAGLSLEN